MLQCQLSNFSFPLTNAAQPTVLNCIPLGNMSKTLLPDDLIPAAQSLEGFGGGCYHIGYKKLIPYSPSKIDRIFRCALDYFDRTIGMLYPNKEKLQLNSAPDNISLLRDAKHATPVFLDICSEVAETCHGQVHFSKSPVKEAGKLRKEIERKKKNQGLSLEQATQRIDDVLVGTIVIDSKKQVQCVVNELNQLIDCRGGKIFWKNMLQEKEDGNIGFEGHFSLPFTNFKKEQRQVRCILRVQFQALMNAKQRLHRISQTNQPPALQVFVKNTISKLNTVTAIASIGSSCKTSDFLNQRCKKVSGDLCKDPDFSWLCKGNLIIPRIEMPQIEKDVLCEFLQSLEKEGIQIGRKEIPTKMLTPVQSELNATAVDQMLDSLVRRASAPNPCKETIVVAEKSNQYFVIDGHHRYATCRLMKGAQQAIVIHADVFTVLEKARKFPGVKFQTMQGDSVKKQAKVTPSSKNGILSKILDVVGNFF